MESEDGEAAMITFDFDYCRPDSVAEAVKAFKDLAGQGKSVIYYGGGTEIISLARLNQLRFNAVIDIKGIPECNVLEFRGNRLLIGAAVTLTKICGSGLFPFLGTACRKAADHTARDKITLGGNICGRSPYKEAVLPLLVSDSEITLAGESGIKSMPLAHAFNRELALGSGEFLVQVAVDKSFTAIPYTYIKKTRQETVGYPLVAIAAVRMGNRVRAAFSGLNGSPFRLREVEEDWNNGSVSHDERINNIMCHLPRPFLNDMLGSAEYREFVVRNAISEAVEKLGGME